MRTFPVYVEEDGMDDAGQGPRHEGTLLTDDQICTERRVARRSLLARAGLALIGAAGVVFYRAQPTEAVEMPARRRADSTDFREDKDMLYSNGPAPQGDGKDKTVRRNDPIKIDIGG
jgi:hypothetical protein